MSSAFYRLRDSCGVSNLPALPPATKIAPVITTTISFAEVNAEPHRVVKPGEIAVVAITPGASDGQMIGVTSTELKDGDAVITSQREAP